MSEYLFNKIAGLRLTIYQKDTLAQVFSGKFCEIFKAHTFQNIYKQPLLYAELYVMQLALIRDSMLKSFILLIIAR